MDNTIIRHQGTLRSWLLSYNIGMLLIFLTAVIILFGLLFALLEQMQTRNSQYAAINSFSSQVALHHHSFLMLSMEQDSHAITTLLKEQQIIDHNLQASLQRLAVTYDNDPCRYFIYRGIVNGLQFISISLTTLLSMKGDYSPSEEYFSLFYTIDKVYTYLQEYAVNRYLPQIVRADIAWILTTEHKILNYRAITILLFVLIAITYTIATYEMTMRLVRPVDTMVQSARQIINGHFDGPEIPIEGPVELQYLEQSMNQMRESLRERMEMIEENAQLEKRIHRQEVERIRTTRELEKARYNALQSQINPHFLFNTLNVISRTALFEGADATVDLLDTLASIFRYTLQHHDDVTLAEELLFVRKYLTIQQYRFKERLTFSVECPPQLSDLRIPPLVVQPFVENAMIHGLEPKVEGGSVTIAVAEVAKSVVITITDTGVGIDLEQLGRAQKEGKQHIGIKNITDRLNLYYKGKAQVDIGRVNEAGGTTVTITLPYRSGGKKSVHPTDR